MSVEEKLAANLRIQVGDRLTFSVAGQNREVQVQSLRKVKWDNFQPNFFMVFQPGTLTDLPVTYLTSFYLPASQERDLIELARAFPTVTLLPVDALLSQLRSILDQVTLAVEYVLVFVLAAGFVVLFAGLRRPSTSACARVPCCARWVPSASCCDVPGGSSSPCSAQSAACSRRSAAGGQPAALPTGLRPAVASAPLVARAASGRRRAGRRRRPAGYPSRPQQQPAAGPARGLIGYTGRLSSVHLWNHPNHESLSSTAHRRHR